jgi:putative ABC transport system ATP-binding protein
MEIITAADVSKYRSKDGKNIHVLKNINLHIESGDFVAITGPSGNSITTLLRLFCGIVKPDEGKIFFCGLNTKELSKWQRKIIPRDVIGTIFQDEKLVPFVSILDNVSAPLISKGEKRKVALEKSYTILDNFGIGELGNKKTGKLSEEQRQMVIIARAIIKESNIIIADEITSNLNNENRKKTIRILEDLNKTKNATIIISTSDDTILEYAKRVIFLRDGTIDMKKSKGMEIGRELSINVNANDLFSLIGPSKNSAANLLDLVVPENISLDLKSSTDDRTV